MKNKAKKICEKLVEHNHIAVFAGGCVRDMLLNLEPNDIDIATDALPEEVESLFSYTLSIGKAFGVILVKSENEEFEIATFRTDSSSSDGRRPNSVNFSSMEEDAKRRDLTINGMFYDPLQEKLYDFVNGVSDLENKIIRLIGDPQKRIEEDHLRLLRVIRFAAKFDFKIEIETLKAVKENSYLISSVSKERISEELSKILRLKNRVKAFRLLHFCGLLEVILPEVFNMIGCEQPFDYHPEGDVFEHTLLALSSLPPNSSDRLLWGTLLHDVGKPLTQTFEDRIRFTNHDSVGAKLSNEILRRLKFSNDFCDSVSEMVENHMKFSCVQQMRKSRLKRLMNLKNFNDHLALHKADCHASNKNFDSYNFICEAFKTNDFKPENVIIDKLPKLITGHDLINRGIEQGPFIKFVLIDIQNKQLENEITSREEALKLISSKEYLDKIKQENNL